MVAFGLLGGGLTISSLLAQEAPPAGFSRVYINIQSGSKGAVVSAVAGAGGNIHYEFDTLVSCQVSNVGYRRLSLIRASLVLNLQFIFAS